MDGLSIWVDVGIFYDGVESLSMSGEMQIFCEALLGCCASTGMLYNRVLTKIRV